MASDGYLDDLAEALAENRQLKAEIEKLKLDKVRLAEVERLLADCLEDDDFMPCYDQRNHMVGPALRGTIERALAELNAATKEGE